VAGNRYLLDTNILISGLLFKGNERDLLALGRAKKVSLLLSNMILKEFQIVLGKKFEFEKEDVDLALAYVLEAIEEIVPVPEKINEQEVGTVRDRADVHVLAAARAVRAVIVTGDKDLLEIPIKRVKVIRCLDVLKSVEENVGEK
jgi:putative PIN family toxin of toxin-antitoxin system